MTRDEILSWFLPRLADVCGLDPAEIDLQRTFESHGADSYAFAALAGEAEDELGIPVAPSTLWKYPVISDFVDHVVSLTATSSE